jgi:hypothetical protein
MVYPRQVTNLPHVNWTASRWQRYDQAAAASRIIAIIRKVYLKFPAY